MNQIGQWITDNYGVEYLGHVKMFIPFKDLAEKTLNEWLTEFKYRKIPEPAREPFKKIYLDLIQ